MTLPGSVEIATILLLLFQPLIFTVVTTKIIIKEINFIKTFFYFIGIEILVRITSKFISTYMDPLLLSQLTIVYYLIKITIILLLTIAYIMMFIKYKDNTHISFMHALKIGIVSIILCIMVFFAIGYIYFQDINSIMLMLLL